MNHDQLMRLKKGDVLSLMAVNNETGVIQPVAALSERIRSQGVIVHTDAVQAVGKMPFSFKEFGVDALTLSTHKCGGPKGAGALVVSKRLDIQPLLRGGGQERGRRSGTEPVGLIVGFAEALVKAMAQQSEWLKHVKPLRDMLEHGLRARGAEIFGASVDRVANTTYFAFNGIHGDSWVMYLDRVGLAVSSGSACSSQHATVSHVLTAMGYDQEKAMSAVRVSLGWCNTVATIQSFLAAIDAGLKEFSGMMGMVSPHKAI
jgi:cysteine desulfurase